MQPSVLIGHRAILQQLRQGQRGDSDKVISTDFIPVENIELDDEGGFKLLDVEEQFFIPDRVEAVRKGEGQKCEAGFQQELKIKTYQWRMTRVRNTLRPKEVTTKGYMHTSLSTSID